MEYTCKDCIFFMEGTCKTVRYGWDVDAMDTICTDFEYKNEFKI